MPQPEAVLNQGGLYTDELSLKLRILDPNTHRLNVDLLNECEEYLTASAECKQNCESMMKSLKDLVEVVNAEKRRAMWLNTRLLYTSANNAKNRSLLTEQINDRKEILNRLTLQKNSLMAVEKELEETVKLLM